MLTPTLYRIDKTHMHLKGSKETQEIIDIIFRQYNLRKNIKSSYENLIINKHKIDDVNYLFYNTEQFESESDWKNFLPNHLIINSSFTQKNISLFLFIEAHNELFCIVGGTNTYNRIVPYIDHSFGLDTYSRIMSPSQDELISIKTRTITGNRAGSNDQFRNTYKIIDFVRFGKVPTEIHVKLDLLTAELYFPFVQNKIDEQINISVGKGFKIKKSINFNQLHDIILAFENILQLDKSDYLSSFKEIKEKEFIEEKLNPLLHEKLFQDVQLISQNDPDDINRFKFDFCNPNDINQFYDADYYQLKEKNSSQYKLFATISDREDIYRTVIDRAITLQKNNNPFDLKVYLQGVKIYCYKENSKKNTVSSSFLFHISAEFNLGEKPYFLIDNKWYYLRDSFLSDLKITTTQILKSYNAPKEILILDWENWYKRESDYNFSYFALENYLVLDEILIDGIELCDILYYNDDNLYLIHVKKGFERKMRELTNQILISAQRLKSSISTTDKKLLKILYKNLTVKNLHKDLSEIQFLDLFKKNIKYVLAFTSQFENNTIVADNPSKYKSNIARYSLISCSSDMRANYFDMYTFQINKSNKSRDNPLE